MASYVRLGWDSGLSLLSFVSARPGGMAPFEPVSPATPPQHRSTASAKRAMVERLSRCADKRRARLRQPANKTNETPQQRYTLWRTCSSQAAARPKKAEHALLACPCTAVAQRKKTVGESALASRKLGGRASATMALVAVTATLLAGIYPDGHFDHVTKVTDETMFNALVKEQVDAGKTLFVRWIASEG